MFPKDSRLGNEDVKTWCAKRKTSHACAAMVRGLERTRSGGECTRCDDAADVDIAAAVSCDPLPSPTAQDIDVTQHRIAEVAKNR